MKEKKTYINNFARIESDWYTNRHLYQCVEEHKGSTSIGNHTKEQHGTVPSDIYRDFKILRKCQSKFDCLIYEMLFIRQTVRFNPCKVIYLGFFSFIVFYHFNTYILAFVFTYIIVWHSHALICTYICIFHSFFLQLENDLREIEKLFFKKTTYKNLLWSFDFLGRMLTLVLSNRGNFLRPSIDLQKYTWKFEKVQETLGNTRLWLAFRISRSQTFIRLFLSHEKKSCFIYVKSKYWFLTYKVFSAPGLHNRL